MKSTFSPDIDEYLRAPEAEDGQPTPSRKPAVAIELLTPSRIGLQQPPRQSKEAKKVLKATTSLYG